MKKPILTTQQRLLCSSRWLFLLLRQMHFLFGDKVYFQFIFSRSSLSAVKRIYGLFVSVLAPWVMFGIKGLFFEKQAILSLLFKLACIFNGKDSKNACNKCISQIKYQLHVLFGHCAKNKYGIPWDGHGRSAN